jgi:hypothetical protein
VADSQARFLRRVLVPMAYSSSATAASQSAEAGALPVSPFDLLAIFAAVYLASRLFRALFRTAPPAPTATKPKRN